MLISRENSALLVVDVQERLLPHIHEQDRLLENIVWLVKVAQKLGVPVAATEQYPKGLGRTPEELRDLLPTAAIAEKVHFSCVAAQCLGPLPGMDRPQIVIAGIESHVCVLQTAIELREKGKQVFVVADAVSSRDRANRDQALARMRGHGVDIVTREMAAFEWLHQAGTELFREVSGSFLR